MTNLTTGLSLIEVQFPVAKLSMESYKERKANSSQTLTSLGKWWGRKPLILIRAILLGLLLPASDEPQKDRDILFKLLTMDEEGPWRRKIKPIPLKEMYAHISSEERKDWFDIEAGNSTPHLKPSLTAVEREFLQHLVFESMSYDEKLAYCTRPECIDGPSQAAWAVINNHLNTQASTLEELIYQLGVRRFGHKPVVGDAFCGGGSIPFEAARLGFEAYGSDLNPVASLLTWASLSVIGGGAEVPAEVLQAQERVYYDVDQQVTAWEIEHNEQGWRADAYLYCTETQCPECGWMIPLAPSWVIGEGTNTIAKLIPNWQLQNFEIAIESGVSRQAVEAAQKSGTVKNSLLICPNHHCRQSTPLMVLRGDRRPDTMSQHRLRLWENDDLVPRQDDLLQERLYCIRWIATHKKKGKEATTRLYSAPDDDDFKRERMVLSLLRERFQKWQEMGYIPSHQIEPGEKTSEPIRTRGWTYWHHLFNPRQLLLIGLLSERMLQESCSSNITLSMLLGIGRSCDYNARLSRWHPHNANEKSEQIFSNQALNTLFNYGTRTLQSLRTTFFLNCIFADINTISMIQPLDARNISRECDIWLTDPPYGDSVAYHELSEFFLAWYEKHLARLLPKWYTGSRRECAIFGSGEKFCKDMVACYKQLAEHMPEQGMQVVLFTHQDTSVWADLALILWASSLSVTAAWCIATETDSAFRKGNYVQGTVILVLRKRASDGEQLVFLDDIYHEVDIEVKKQLATMTSLDDQATPIFSDIDYYLAAYAAALRTLTRHTHIEGIDVAYELSKSRTSRDEASVVEKIIAHALKIACDCLVPRNFASTTWRLLSADERFYLKGLDLESRGESRIGAYQELAKGFGIKSYTALLSSTKANQVRLKTPTEFATRILGGTGFGSSPLRQVLFAIRESIRTSEVSFGKRWLRAELSNYWDQRKTLIEILGYLGTLKMEHWNEASATATMLAGALKTDHI